MKKQLFSILLAAASLTAAAIPAFPGKYRAVGPDGEPIVVQRIGNAGSNVFIDQTGRKLVKKSNRTFSLMPQAQEATQRAAARKPGVIGTFPGTTFPAKGKQKAIVILVEFKDKKMELGNKAFDYFNNMLNKEGFNEYGGTGSVRDYFLDSSNGQFDCQFDLYGPVTLKNKLEYYGRNVGGKAGNDANPQEMVVEACQQLNAQVDFSQYDRDGDGVIDNVYIIYAGRGEATDVFEEHPELIWPHSSSVRNLNLTFDGKKLDTYGCSSEWDDTFEYDDEDYIVGVGDGRPDGIGTFTHEFSHILGLPDLYKTIDDYDEVEYTPGNWSILDYGPYNNGGCTPPAYSSFERNALGWIDLKDLPSTGDVTIPELNGSNVAYAISNPTNSGEFFLFEARERKGWDAYLPGTGMLVWHVDYDSKSWDSNTVNNSNYHQGVDLVEADGVVGRGYSSPSDAFPGMAKITSYRPKWWDDGFTGHFLKNITANTDGSVSFAIESVADIAPSDGDYLTVKQVQYSTMDDSKSTVRGYIVGYVANSPIETGCRFTSAGCKVNTNIILADDPSETDPSNIIAVALPAAVRSGLSLRDHPENLGRYVELKGTLSKYFGVPGFKNVSSYEFIEQGTDGIDEITVGNSVTGPVYDLQGRQVLNPAHGIFIVNGRKVFLK